MLYVFVVALTISWAESVFAAPPMKASKKDAIQWLEENKAPFEDAAMAIHGFAETGLLEYKSSKYLADMLEDNGFTVERGVADMPTAFVATFGSGKPVIGILAEYDALPGLSQKGGVPSQEAIIADAPGHGCGHNVFGAGSTAAAIAMKEIMQKRGIKGTVKLYGCPAEETLIGKVYMAKAGLFDDLDACLNWHPGSGNGIFLGSNNAMNNFEVTFRGRTAHAAGAPHSGRSALDGVELMNIGVNFLREHVRDTVRIHYMIKDGGRAPNIVPESATVWYFVRDKNREGVDHVYERVLQCAEGASIMTDTSYEVTLTTGSHNYLNNNTISRVVYDNLAALDDIEYTDDEQAWAKEMQRNMGAEEKGLSLGTNEFKKPSKNSAASTDASDISWIVPTSGEMTTAVAPGGVPGHHWCWVSASGSSAGLKGMLHAAKALATSGIELMLDEDLLKDAWKEFEVSTDGKAFKSALPLDQKPPVMPSVDGM